MLAATRVARRVDMEENRTEPSEDRRETQHERLDRNLNELIGELRVIVTGVQVLFAFLLIVPFNAGFSDVSDFEKTVYFGTLVFTTLAALCMIAPSAEHRFLFRRDDKLQIVFSSNRIVIVGLGFLALAMCGCLLLVTSKLDGVVAGAFTAGFAALSFLLLWFVLPLRRLRELESREAGNPDGARVSSPRRGGQP